MKILMVLTSHDRLGDTGKKTGFWLEEFAAPYYELADAGVEVSMASPLGGLPPLDPKSDLPDGQTSFTDRFHQDRALQGRLARTVKLSDVFATDFDAVFYPGGHGPLWDLPDNPSSIALIESFVAAGKPVAAVCHAPIALKNVRTRGGDLLVKGRDVTGVSNSEEEAVGLTAVVPELLEDVLRRDGANYLRGAEDFAPFVVVDEDLITGQNPASSAPAALQLLAMLRQ